MSDMGLRLPSARPRRAFVFWALAAASLVVSHDAVFLVQLGPGESLVRTLRGGGHAYWEAASTVLLGVALVAAAAIAVRLATLVARARSAPGRRATAVERRRGRVGQAAWLWLRLFAVVTLGFTIQENVEHLAGHDHFIGLSALHGIEYPLALPVLALVTLVAAAGGALVLEAEHDLLAAVAALESSHVRPPRILPRPTAQLRRPRPSPLASRQAGRAPPSVLVVTSIA